MRMSFVSDSCAKDCHREGTNVCNKRVLEKAKRNHWRLVHLISYSLILSNTEWNCWCTRCTLIAEASQNVTYLTVLKIRWSTKLLDSREQGLRGEIWSRSLWNV